MTPFFARLLVIVILALLISPSPLVRAADTGVGAGGTDTGVGGGTSVKLMNPLGAGTDVPKLIDAILAFVVKIGSVVVIFMLVYVGYKFVVAQGNSEAISEARRALLWTVVGALVLLGAQAIAIGIQATVQAISEGR